jgi:hypothetical protein
MSVNRVEYYKWKVVYQCSWENLVNIYLETAI